jgi:hypothetical protein
MLDAAEKQRLAKLLGMLGSSFDGERANAARMISALAERHRLTIVEMVLGAQQYSRMEEPPRPKARQEKAKSRSNPILTALRNIAAECDDWEFTLTEWECQFARDVSERYEADYQLSDKQMVICERIIKKVERVRERGGEPS